MEGIVYRQLQKEDIGFAYEMIKTELWNDRVEDLMRTLEYEPKGCFLAESDGTPAGHIFSVSYGKLGWIGLLIVDKAYRRMGIGRALMLKAQHYLLSQGVKTIRLEAVPEISKLYREIGFVDEYDSLRFKGTPSHVLSAENRSVTSMSEKTIEEVAEFDAGYFGAKRTKVLIKLYQSYPELCFVSRKESQISGYIMCRKAENGYKVGPWICIPKEEETAKYLLMACLEKLGREDTVYVGVPAPNQSAANVLRHFEFLQYSKTIRMRFGKSLREHVDGVFAIGGPMKG